MKPMRFALLLVLIGVVGVAVVATGFGMVFGPGVGVIVAGLPLLAAGVAGLLIVNVDTRARK